MPGTENAGAIDLKRYDDNSKKNLRLNSHFTMTNSSCFTDIIRNGYNSLGKRSLFQPLVERIKSNTGFGNVFLIVCAASSLNHGNSNEIISFLSNLPNALDPCYRPGDSRSPIVPSLRLSPRPDGQQRLQSSPLPERLHRENERLKEELQAAELKIAELAEQEALLAEQKAQIVKQNVFLFEENARLNKLITEQAQQIAELEQIVATGRESQGGAGSENETDVRDRASGRQDRQTDVQTNRDHDSDERHDDKNHDDGNNNDNVADDHDNDDENNNNNDAGVNNDNAGDNKDDKDNDSNDNDAVRDGDGYDDYNGEGYIDNHDWKAEYSNPDNMAVGIMGLKVPAMPCNGNYYQVYNKVRFSAIQWDNVILNLGGGKHQCSQCNTSQKTCKIKHHVWTKHFKGGFFCNICKLCYSEISAVTRHEKICEGHIYTCTRCEKEFSSTYGARRHHIKCTPNLSMPEGLRK